MTAPEKLTEEQFKDEFFVELDCRLHELYRYYCEYYEREVESGFDPSMSYFVTIALDGLAETF